MGKSKKCKNRGCRRFIRSHSHFCTEHSTETPVSVPYPAAPSIPQKVKYGFNKQFIVKESDVEAVKSIVLTSIVPSYSKRHLSGGNRVTLFANENTCHYEALLPILDNITQQAIKAIKFPVIHPLIQGNISIVIPSPPPG